MNSMDVIKAVILVHAKCLMLQLLGICFTNIFMILAKRMFDKFIFCSQ